MPFSISGFETGATGGVVGGVAAGGVVVGGTGDHLAFQAVNRFIVDDRPQRARREDVAIDIVDFVRRHRFRPEIALTRLGLAELLLDHYSDERPAAIEHLDFAIAEFRAMKMQASLKRALKHKDLLKA